MAIGLLKVNSKFSLFLESLQNEKCSFKKKTFFDKPKVDKLKLPLKVHLMLKRCQKVSKHWKAS